MKMHFGALINAPRLKTAEIWTKTEFVLEGSDITNKFNFLT